MGYLRDLGEGERITLRQILQSGSVMVPQDRVREDDNQLRGGRFFDQVSDCRILAKVSVPGAHLRLLSNSNRNDLTLCSLDILYTAASYSDSGIVVVFLSLSSQFKGNTSRWAYAYHNT